MQISHLVFETCTKMRSNLFLKKKGSSLFPFYYFGDEMIIYIISQKNKNDYIGRTQGSGT